MDIESLSEELEGRLDTRSFRALQAIVLQAAAHDAAALQALRHADRRRRGAHPRRSYGAAAPPPARSTWLRRRPAATRRSPAGRSTISGSWSGTAGRSATPAPTDPSLGTAEARALAASLDARLAGLEPCPPRCRARRYGPQPVRAGRPRRPVQHCSDDLLPPGAPARARGRPAAGGAGSRRRRSRRQSQAASRGNQAHPPNPQPSSLTRRQTPSLIHAPFAQQKGPSDMAINPPSTTISPASQSPRRADTGDASPSGQSTPALSSPNAPSAAQGAMQPLASGQLGPSPVAGRERLGTWRPNATASTP